MKHTIQRVFCCCLLLAILPLPLPVGAQPQAVSNAQQAKSLIVKIRAKNEFGAGIIFSLRGGYLFIATAKHVVMDSPRALGELTVEFEFLRGVAVPAEFFQADTIFDLAVLRVDVGNSRLRDAAGVTIPFDLLGKTVALQPGDQVYPVGHPEGASWDVPLTPSVMKQVNYEQLRLEPACLKGQSGGGLFDADWTLVGMISRTRGLSCEALSFERICGTLEYDWGLVVNREPLPLVSEPPASTTPSVVEQQQQKIAALLEQAEIYFSKAWYTTPPGTNAFDLYLEVLRLDPDNQQAWQKIEQMRAFYKSRAEQAEQQGNPQKAIRYYERYLKIEPNDDEVLDKLYALQTPAPPPRPTSTPTPHPTALPTVVPSPAPTTPTPQPTPPTAKHPLRSQPGTYSGDEIEQMVKAKGFRDSSWNPQGDFPNEYESKTLNGDKVVIDHASGLMWQQGGSPDYMPWSEAQAYVDELNRNRFAGFSDWRLPTIEELASLLEPTEQNGDLYIDPKFDAHQRWCWSSDKRSSGSAWYVVFNRGLVPAACATSSTFALCVPGLDYWVI